MVLRVRRAVDVAALEHERRQREQRGVAGVPPQSERAVHEVVGGRDHAEERDEDAGRTQPRQSRRPPCRERRDAGERPNEDGRSEQTRRKLVEAVRAVLVEEGFAGASTRAIAAHAGVNQALVFYHFDGVEPLLLAALDASSAERLVAYRAAVDEAGSLPELVAALGPLLVEDEASGHMTVLTELVGASLSRSDLRRAMIERAAPWRQLTEEAATRFLAGTPFAPAADDVASLTVAVGLGLNMFARLDPEAARLPNLAKLAALLSGE